MYRLELIAPKDIQQIIHFLQMLNEGMPESLIQQRLEEMLTNGYECLGVFDGDNLIAICGMWTLTKVYVGKHIEPDNVIVLPQYRSKGIGELMMNWVEQYAATKGCIALELNAYVTNEKGIAFWKRNGYKILGHHFQKKIET